MFENRLRKNRQFFFKPFYYDPEKDKTNKRHFEFKRKIQRRAAKQKSLISLIILLAFVVYLIYLFISNGK